MKPSEIETKFGVDEATVRSWVKKGIHPDKRKSNGKISKVEGLEKELLQLLKKKREEGKVVTSNVIFSEMKKLTIQTYQITDKEYNDLQNYAHYCAKKKIAAESILFKTSQEHVFTLRGEEEVQLTSTEIIQLRDSFLKIQQKLIVIDKSWLYRFTQKAHLSYRKITHTSPKSQKEAEESVLDFLQEVREIRAKEDIPPELILNFDEMGVFYDMIPSYTYDLLGTKHPGIKTSKLQKKRITVGLTITAAGDKLSPILIFQGKGKRINKLINTKNYVVKKNCSAWMTLDLYQKYLTDIIKPYVLSQRKKSEFANKKALLIVDNFSGHNLSEEAKKKFYDLGIIIKHLRPYTTSMCQPLDLCINYLIKKFMKDEWIKWFDTDPSLNPTKQMIYNWFAKAFQSITFKDVIKAFLMSGISNELDGSEDLLSSMLLKFRKEREQIQQNLTVEEQVTQIFFEDEYDKHHNQFNPYDERNYELDFYEETQQM